MTSATVSGGIRYRVGTCLSSMILGSDAASPAVDLGQSTLLPLIPAPTRSNTPKYALNLLVRPADEVHRGLFPRDRCGVLIIPRLRWVNASVPIVSRWSTCRCIQPKVPKSPLKRVQSVAFFLVVGYFVTPFPVKDSWTRAGCDHGHTWLSVPLSDQDSGRYIVAFAGLQVETPGMH